MKTDLLGNGVPHKDRRLDKRITASVNLRIIFRDIYMKPLTIEGALREAGPEGFSCLLNSELPTHVKLVSAELMHGEETVKIDGKLLWRNNKERLYGIQLREDQPNWWIQITKWQEKNGWQLISDRRQLKRRTSEANLAAERRRNSRRFSDIFETYSLEYEPGEISKAKILLRNKAVAFEDSVISERREWLSKLTGVSMEHIGAYSEPLNQFKGKIENLIGVSQIPLGIAGPLRMNGEHAQGTFYIPLATTEGALVTSYTLGMNITTRAGGINTHILKDEMRVSPVFKFDNLRQSQIFADWVQANFKRIKEEAEKSTSHGKLLKLEPVIHGHRVILKFWYSTGDAMGMNMICKATEDACKMIVSSVKPKEFFLRSNYSSNKKVAYANLIDGYGKTVTADVAVPRKLIEMLDITPERMVAYYQATVQAGIHAGMVGSNGHFANGLTALFIACGQDVATVVNASNGLSYCEVTETGDLYVSAYVSNLLIGTVGGGTGFGTASECLRMMGCFGDDKAKKLAEIAAALCLCGEISICASIANGTYVAAHEMYGRNRPT